MPLKLIKIVILLSLSFIVSCSVNQPNSTTYSDGEPLQDDSINDEGSEPSLSSNAIALNRTRIIADILYEAKYALEDNKLLLPAGDNAYDRYQEVLDIEPNNQVAFEGIEEIVLRYVQLADSAMQQGQYAEANSLLNRGASIGQDSKEIQEAYSRLSEARKTKVDFIALDPEGLSQQSLDMLVTLAEIAETVKTAEATFLITARTDEEGRWIYKTMRESLGGYRLRGNIVLGNEPRVQINSSN